MNFLDPSEILQSLELLGGRFVAASGLTRMWAARAARDAVTYPPWYRTVSTASAWPAVELSAVLLL